MNKHKIFLGILTFVAASALFTACKKDRVVVIADTANLYQDYMPLEVGKYIIYDIDSSIWDDAKCFKYTYKYQHQYIVADTFRDGQKRLSYVINVLSRLKVTDNFVVNDVIYYTPASERFEFVEKNIRFVRLINPIVENKVWNGNVLMPVDDQDYAYLKNWKYTYQNVNKPYNNGVVDFENTVTVSETDQILNNPETMPTSYASLLQSKSVYAFRVGLIYREYSSWIYDPAIASCRKGAGVVMRAVEYN